VRLDRASVTHANPSGACQKRDEEEKETLVIPFTVQWSLTYETKDGKTKILKYFLVLFPSTDF
jgi:hypothetical protein